MSRAINQKIKLLKLLNKKRTKNYHFNSGTYICTCDDFPIIVIEKGKGFKDMTTVDAEFVFEAANFMMELIKEFEEKKTALTKIVAITDCNFAKQIAEEALYDTNQN